MTPQQNARFYDALEALKHVSKEIPVHEWTDDQRAVFNLAHKILRDHRGVNPVTP